MPRKAVSQRAGFEGSGSEMTGSGDAAVPEPGADQSRPPGDQKPVGDSAETTTAHTDSAGTGIEVDEANGAPQDDGQDGQPPVETGGRKRAAAAVQPPQTIGEALRRARDAAGLTLQDVADRTKVRPGILREIDADAHEKLPALTYSLGFVKAYARTVGMDPAAAAERYRRESLKGDPVPTMVDLQPLEEKRLPTRNIVALATTGLLLALGLFWAWGAGWLNGASPMAVDGALESGIEPVVVAEPPPGAVEVTPTVPPAVNPGAPVTLTAKADVWLRINDGNETFFMGTMVPGQVLTLPPGRDWLLRTGRAGALDVKVGATTIPPLGGAAEQVRNVSLKPADLLARPATSGLAPAPGASGLAPAPATSGLAPVAGLPGAVPSGAQAAPAG